MAETTSSSKSRVLEDIINLEQDFKYNLNLLKIRDIEIEKCNIVNQNLQAKLNRVVAETKELNKKYIQLQHEFEALQQERKEDRKVIETKLSLEDNERRQSHRKIQQIFGNNFSQKSNILQIISEMRIAEQKYKETITTYKTQIGDQTKHLDNLQKKYTNIMEENITLSNKIKDINARKISEICMYKYELEKSSNEIELLKKEIILIQEDYKAYLNSQSKLVKENNELQVKIISISKNYEKCVSENMKFKEEIEILKLKLNTLKSAHSLLTRQDELLNHQITIKSHKALVEQNKIMQEIIKSLRNRVQHTKEINDDNGHFHNI